MTTPQAREDRYRQIFEAVGVSIWEDDFTALLETIDTLRAQGINDIAGYCRSHPEFVRQALDAIRVREVNEATLQMFGASSREQLLAALHTIFPADADPVLARGLQALADGAMPFHDEMRACRISGEPLDVILGVTFSESGHALVSMVDVTARKEAERARRRANDALRREVHLREALERVAASLASELDAPTLARAVTDTGCELTDAEYGAFFYASEGSSDSGYQLHAFSGTTGVADASGTTARLESTFRDAHVIRLADVTTDPRYGDDLPFLGTETNHPAVRSYLGVPVLSSAGEVLGGLFFGHSKAGMFTPEHQRLAAGIAPWAALALDNARLYKLAHEASRLKDEFLATVSHELRTPLQAVLGWTHLLRAGVLERPKEARALEALDRNGRALAKLVDDLLDVSRIVSGKLEIREDPVEIRHVIASAMDAVRPSANAKRVHLEAVSEPGDTVFVTGDGDRLRQVVWNLLTNAMRFTPTGGTVTVAVSRVNGKVHIAVTDTGPGIDPELLPHLFERFRQGQRQGSRHGGLGLGLSIVRHIVELHGGTVMAANRDPGPGAIFTVRLPVKVLRGVGRHHPFLHAARDATLEGARVLLVDDDTEALELLRLLLEAKGATITTASSMRDALQEFEKKPFDIVLSDIGMPDGDGYELIRAIRSRPPSAGGDVRAAALTAYASARNREEALGAGFNWHLTKPTDLDQLVHLIAGATSERTPPA